MANWANTATLGDTSSPEWQAENLTWIEPVPGQRWQVYKPAAAQFEGLIKDLVAASYKPTSSGGFNYRKIRGGDKLSQHAFGTAIDMNAMTNALGSKVSDIPNARELAEKHNLEWGGNWKGRPDPMHFEYRGGGQQPTRDDLAQVAAAAAPEAAAAAQQEAAMKDFSNPISGYGGGPQPAPDPQQPLLAGKSPVPEEGIFGLRGKQKGEKETWRDKLAKGIADLGSFGGGGGAVPQIRSTPQIPTMMTQAPQVAPIDQNAALNQRQQLAMALSRLNSGKTFVG